MIIKTIIEEDFTNYKKPSMVIGMPHCTFKCGEMLCQNSILAKSPDKKINDDVIIYQYLENNLTKAICFAGLEPMDSFNELCAFIRNLRINKKCEDDIVIYTGYTKDEIKDYITILQQFTNIIIKFGRYIPGQQVHKDEILGVDLASDNQYAEKIS